MKIACIINGQLRVKDIAHANRLNRLFRDCDVYIRSYPEYAKTARFLNHKRAIINKTPKVPQSNLYQYYTLQDTVRTYKSELLEYDLIFRYRTDFALHIDNLATHLREYSFKDNEFYAKTDWIFCCKAKQFVEMFENIYDTMIKKYINRETWYMPIHWENLKLSLADYYGHIRNHWINYPAKYFPANFTSDYGGLVPIINANIKELNKLNDPKHYNHNIKTVTKGFKKRRGILLSTEKFIILYVLQQCPILHFNMKMIMPVPSVRNRWKL